MQLVLAPAVLENVLKSIRYAVENPDQGFPWSVSQKKNEETNSRFRQLAVGDLVWIYTKGHYVILGQVREKRICSEFMREIGWKHRPGVVFDSVFFLTQLHLTAVHFGDAFEFAGTSSPPYAFCFKRLRSDVQQR